MAGPQLMLPTPVGATDRKVRSPKHTFLLSEFAMTAQPFMLAPVLPGETLDNIWFECRTVTNPVENRIIGWKKEFYFFYVKITDLMTDAIRDMFVNPDNADIAGSLGVAGNDNNFYHANGGVDFTKRALKAVMEHWFRDEGEAWDKYKTSWGIPFVQFRDQFWMDSLTDKDLMPEGANIAAATTAGDLERLMNLFEMTRAMGVSGMTFEDYLRHHGINVPNQLENKPELLARFGDFQYPSNTIDPASGAATSAVSWVFKNGEKKRKLFKEPGFILGVSVTRPKVYYSGLAGSLGEFMTRAWDWMPNYLASMPETSLKLFATDTGPLGARTADLDPYWVDMRDLLMYGDQFVNAAAFGAAPANTGAHNLVALPITDGADGINTKNPTEAMINALFKGTDDKSIVFSDGYVNLSILGAQTDHTVGNFAIA